MRCAYTNICIKRRFGVPQGYKPEHDVMQLVGTYGSIGVLIRYLFSRITDSQNNLQEHVLSSLSRVGSMIGRPLALKRNDKNELEYDKEELRKLAELCAPDASALEINGGKMSVKEYTNKDKTWEAPEFNRYGQTEEAVKAQKEEMKTKRAEKRIIKVGKEDEDFRIFFFGVPVTHEKPSKSENLINRVSIEDLNKSGYFSKPRDIHLADTGKGLKIAFSGGNSHNKTATKKFYGEAWKENGILKGDVVIILTNEAPLVMDKYLAPDNGWLVRYREDHNLPNLLVANSTNPTAPFSDSVLDIISKKARTK